MFGKTRDKHPCWKDEKKREFRRMLREIYDYRKWRASVFKRDDYTYRNYSKRGGYLEVHHIVPFSKLLDDNNIETLEDALLYKDLWNIDNGVTYCFDCHAENDRVRIKTKSVKNHLNVK